MSDRELFLDYRRRVIIVGLVASWAGLGLFAVAGARGPGITDNAVLFPLLGFGAALFLFSALPWRKILSGAFADGLILMWCGLAIGAVLLAEGFRNADAVVLALLAVIVFAAATLISPIELAMVGSGATIGHVVVLVAADEPPGVLEGAARVGGFVVTALLLLFAALGISRRMRTTRERLVELAEREEKLAHRERELERLYEVSRTIGYGSSLNDVLPELVGRVTSAVGANTGLVLLYQADGERLEVVSPIWVNGHTVRAEGYSLPIATSGIAQRVFTSCSPTVENSLETEASDAFLSELDAAKVAAVPLQIESRPIGVLVTADKIDGDFTQTDIQLLESLAGPSALVLNQMARYEEARETGQKMAELARLKTDFVSVVSHELRTPLTSIIGSLKTLQRPELSPTDPNAVELLRTAARQGQRLRSLIEDLLVVSRLDNQALPIRPQIVDVREFLDEVVKDVPGARPVVSIDVMEGAEKIWLDASHASRAIRNLIENALKYAPGSPVELDARGRGTEIWISVTDHGEGIPYELHEHIFDRFTQVDAHETRGAGGTGLGLSIVRGLIEAMGGRVWFEPTESGGSTFSIALPARAGTRAARADLRS